MLFAYIPPYGSTSYIDGEDNGIMHLENYICQLSSIYEDSSLLISGDFNARTKDIADYIIDDNCKHLPLPNFYTCDDLSVPRKSRDLHGEVNTHGRSLLNMCSVHGLHMLN